ncbi:hypothetical protein GIB67_029371 [Kingdonia uniflora]|uniref:Uncharacterized protein n=1 Tax=Kingdonia uniflora TaxID=39325 RepID=A0A7J7NTD6_9MAGN|nr:hypothetical protein GIB67_029371 [Kingdonia uniflora]
MAGQRCRNSYPRWYLSFHVFLCNRIYDAAYCVDHLFLSLMMTSSMNDHKVIIRIIGKRETQPHGELQPHGIRNMSFSVIIRVESKAFRVLNVSILSSHSLNVWNEKALIFYFTDGARSYLQTKLLGQMLYYVLTTGSGQQTLGEEYCYITQEYELRCNYTHGK